MNTFKEEWICYGCYSCEIIVDCVLESVTAPDPPAVQIVQGHLHLPKRKKHSRFADIFLVYGKLLC